MKKSAIAFACGLCSIAISGQASAQKLGENLDVAFSADRLFGITFSKVTTERPGDLDSHVDTTRFSFGWGGRSVVSPYEIPRAAIDVFVANRLSLGGSIGFANVSVDSNDNRGNPDYSTFLLAPRVGYVWGLSNTFSFWLRGGLSYHSAHDTDGNETGLGLTFEPTFVFTPVDHFGIVFGPTLDLDVTGDVDSGPNRVARRNTTFGLLQVGILGWL